MEHQNFNAHVRNILSADSPSEVVQRMYTILMPHGLAGVVYSGTYVQEPVCWGSDNVHRWVAHFVINNYFEVDPLYQAARRSVLAQYWQTSQPEPGHTPLQHRIYQEAASFGLAQGFDLSIRDAGGEASLCFYYGNAEPVLQYTPIEHLSKLCALYGHERIRQLTEEQLPPPAPPPPNLLTHRERACLKSVQNGKNYLEIALDLGITERTVGFHLTNAKRKLQAQTLAQAIAYAMKNNFI